MVDITGQYMLNLLLNGLLIGVIYALMALGLTLIFSVLGIVSFAHGEFYMIGGYVAFFVINDSLGAGWHPIFGIVMAGLVTQLSEQDIKDIAAFYAAQSGLFTVKYTN